MRLSIFSWAHLPSEYPLWWTHCPHLLPMFSLGSLFDYSWDFQALISSIPDPNPLAHLWLEGLFSQSMSCFYSLYSMFFKEQNWKTLMKSSVSIFFSFMDNAFVVLSKNPLANPRQKRVSPSCPSISCLVLAFILSSDQLWDHFYKVWVSLFPPYGCSIISAPFVEKTIKKKIF